MPSKFTENYGLNQWEPGDKVVHTDFNEDNRKIDAALKALDEKKISHIKAAWYWGKGTDRQFIDVGFHPDGVAVFASDQQGSADMDIHCNKNGLRYGYIAVGW